MSLSSADRKPTLLIDGDVVLYSAAAACEREVRWDEDNHVLVSNAEECFGAVEHIINGYISALDADPKVYIALSGGSLFRKDIYPEYKAGRTRKPLCYSRLVDKLEEKYVVRKQVGLEGDDLLGIWQTSGKLGDTIIVSSDKDMFTIPGKFYRTTAGELYNIHPQAADNNWMAQVLTGDTSDGYPGCPGIGQKKAIDILREGKYTVEEMWANVVKTFESKGLTQEDALLQARLARILRHSDWDSEKKEVKLWTPQ